ncbi:hypothetical protein [Brevibacillus sp. SAFN-007a]|uniref:hypothetical protein n=1 Tax=Brevibacillus sp. SAFN-007a TaxID=3436862 RepID=UPI003F7EBF2B
MWKDNSHLLTVRLGLAAEFVLFRSFLLTKFAMTLPDGTGLGVASLAKADGKFAWYRTNHPVLVQNNKQEPTPVAKTTVTTRSNKTFTIYLGATRNPTQTMEAENEVVTPIIDQESGLFYHLE